MLLPVHDTPGRLRFVLPAIRGDQRRAAMLRARMRALDGVAEASANPLTGSLIVHYRGAAAREAILGAVSAMVPSGPSQEAKPANALADLLAKAIAERLVEHALRLAVAAAI